MRSIYIRADGTYSNRCALYYGYSVWCPDRGCVCKCTEFVITVRLIAVHDRNAPLPQPTPQAGSMLCCDGATHPQLQSLPLTADGYSAGQKIPILSGPHKHSPRHWILSSASGQHIILLIPMLIFFHLRLALPRDLFAYDIPTKM
jgi:hypothetical protein